MKRKRKSGLVIGITGQIGSGKTEVAKIFQKYGAYVISADSIGKEVVEKNPAVLRKLVQLFGNQILTKSGKLRRRELGRIVFANKDARRKLNKIVHPALLRRLSHEVKQARYRYPMVVVDAALLIEWGWHKKVDLTILVNAGKKKKIERLMAKGFTYHEALMRLESQAKYSAFRRHADIIILNNESLEQLELKVKKIIDRITRKGLTL